MRIWLLAITAFVAITAIVGGTLMIAGPDGHSLQLPLAVLKRSPFDNFMIPGCILLFAVGGTNALASIAILTRQRLAPDISMIAGASISGWILVQVILTGALFWLQVVYLGAGTCILLLSLHLNKRSAV